MHISFIDVNTQPAPQQKLLKRYSYDLKKWKVAVPPQLFLLSC